VVSNGRSWMAPKPPRARAAQFRRKFHSQSPAAPRHGGCFMPRSAMGRRAYWPLGDAQAGGGIEGLSPCAVQGRGGTGRAPRSCRRTWPAMFGAGRLGGLRSSNSGELGRGLAIKRPASVRGRWPTWPGTVRGIISRLKKGYSFGGILVRAGQGGGGNEARRNRWGRGAHRAQRGRLGAQVGGNVMGQGGLAATGSGGSLHLDRQKPSSPPHPPPRYDQKTARVHRGGISGTGRWEWDLSQLPLKPDIPRPISPPAR